MKKYKYKIVYKGNSKFMKFLNFFVRIFNKTFMTRYVTTIGSTIYTPNKDLSVPHSTMIHELQHLKDSKDYPVLYELSYLLCLPTLFTMRSFWEKRAHTWSIRYRLARNPISISTYLEFIIKRYTGADYLFMHWSKKRMNNWFVKTCKEAPQSYEYDQLETAYLAQFERIN